MLTRQTALAVSRQFSNLYNSRLEEYRNEAKKAKNREVTVLIPNFNNAHILFRVLESLILQKGVNLKIIIFDNCSDDGSWDIIMHFSKKYSFIQPYRFVDNLGPHQMGHILFRSGLSKYTLFASGNDFFIDEYAVSTLYSVLENDPELALAYGRNALLGSPCEDIDYCFSIPTPSNRKALGLSDACAMDIATWLYTSNEPLWGLYRSDLTKNIPFIYGYGSDHVTISEVAYMGGICGLTVPMREINIEKRDNRILRIEQDQATYASIVPKILHPITESNFCLLAKSYLESLTLFQSNRHEKNETIQRTLQIICKRFLGLMLHECTRIVLLEEAKANQHIINQKPDYEVYEYRSASTFVRTVIVPRLKRAFIENGYTF